jgi:hypothetical protein
LVLKYKYLLFVSLVFLSAALVMPGSASLAAEYHPDEFLSLDLSKAVLSPTPLGPANTFVPAPFKAHSDADGLRAGAEPVAAAPRHARVKQARLEKPRGAPRTRLAHRQHDPLDAQAQDTRMQARPAKPAASATGSNRSEIRAAQHS